MQQGKHFLAHASLEWKVCVCRISSRRPFLPQTGVKGLTSLAILSCGVPPWGTMRTWVVSVASVALTPRVFHELNAFANCRGYFLYECMTVSGMVTVNKLVY